MDTKTKNLSEAAIDWFSKATIYTHILTYLKENNFKILSDINKLENQNEPIIAVGKNGRKEIIEVKDYLTPLNGGEKKKVIEKSDVKQQAKHWLSEVLFSFILNFRRYGKSDKVLLSLALPNTERYKQIIENVKEYFVQNNLNLKVYLVSKAGAVEVYHLNENNFKK